MATAALWAAYAVSGFDQEIEDPEDENPDRRWEQKQHPRHDAILARLLQRATELKANFALAVFLPVGPLGAGREVDPAPGGPGGLRRRRHPPHRRGGGRLAAAEARRTGRAAAQGAEAPRPGDAVPRRGGSGSRRPERGTWPAAGGRRSAGRSLAARAGRPSPRRAGRSARPRLAPEDRQRSRTRTARPGRRGAGPHGTIRQGARAARTAAEPGTRQRRDCLCPHCPVCAGSIIPRAGS